MSPLDTRPAWEAGALTEAAHRSQLRRAVVASTIGTTIEWYDFFLYGTAAALVFGKLFFPKADPLTGTLLSFATYALGFVARPLGGIVFGHFGDRIGRKRLLMISLVLMGGSSAAIGLLPSVATIGMAAPILLTLLRLIQGFAVGGEISGASAMIVEHAPFGRRGYYSSFTLQGVQAGQIIAAAVFLPLSIALSDSAFKSWGWCIPFLLSAVVVFAGYIVRRKVDETPAFQEEAVHGEVPAAPIIQAVRESGGNMLRVICMALMNAIPTATTRGPAVNGIRGPMRAVSPPIVGERLDISTGSVSIARPAWTGAWTSSAPDCDDVARGSVIGG